jgi:NAD(P)-dependent dehydrogenase (short-subunit alcohol dehydrogenase family)
MNRFISKTVLVTGGSSGIGLATARAFAAEGARVVITGRDNEALEQAKAILGANAVAVTSDAGNTADAQSLASILAANGVRLDAVFVNAGAAKFAAFQDVDETLWDQIFNTNIKGPYFQVQALLPLLNPGASIVINGSINARIGMPNTSVYAASKAAVISLAKTLSAELLPRGVRVNVLSPGPVSTPIYGKLGLDAATDRYLPRSTASWAWMPQHWRRPRRRSRRKFPWAASARRKRSPPRCCIWRRPNQPTSWALRSSPTAA